jgi:hypothetical protein
LTGSLLQQQPQRQHFFSAANDNDDKVTIPSSDGKFNGGVELKTKTKTAVTTIGDQVEGPSMVLPPSSNKPPQQQQLASSSSSSSSSSSTSNNYNKNYSDYLPLAHDMMTYINNSPDPYHAVSNAIVHLQNAGFVEWQEEDYKTQDVLVPSGKWQVLLHKE